MAAPIVAFLTMIGGAVSAEDWTVVETEAEYLTHLADRTLTQREETADQYISHSNGTVTGLVQGLQYTGGWEWRDQNICFSGRVGSGPEINACATVERTEDLAKFAWVGWKTFTYEIGAL